MRHKGHDERRIAGPAGRSALRPAVVPLVTLTSARDTPPAKPSGPRRAAGCRDPGHQNQEGLAAPCQVTRAPRRTARAGPESAQGRAPGAPAKAAPTRRGSGQQRDLPAREMAGADTERREDDPPAASSPAPAVLPPARRRRARAARPPPPAVGFCPAPRLPRAAQRSPARGGKAAQHGGVCSRVRLSRRSRGPPAPAPAAGAEPGRAAGDTPRARPGLRIRGNAIS